MKTRSLFSTMATTLALTLQVSFAAYLAPGHGLQVVHSGTLHNGAMYLGTAATWTNTTPSQPYSVQTSFTMPTADQIVLGRLFLTVWGGSAGRTNVMDITVNGTSLVGGSWTFGTTNDVNPVFSPSQPSAYGSGFGVWFVSLPITPSLLHLDGTPNVIQVNETLPTFDGRINQISLFTVYQDSALGNLFQYALAEGSGDIYGNPTGPQVDSRALTFGDPTPANPVAAAFSAVYTYGDTNQNDRLYFNGTQLGGDDLATWGGSGKSLNFGPDVVTYDVLSLLGSASNQVMFTVSSLHVPGSREASLRPQIAVFGITAVPEPSVGLLALLGASLGCLLRRRA